MSPPLGSVRAKYIVDFAPRYFKESNGRKPSEQRNLEIILTKKKKKPSNKPTGEAVNAANREIERRSEVRRGNNTRLEILLSRFSGK